METRFPFTDAKIARLILPDGKSEQLFYDTKTVGLAVRLVKTGSRSYVYFARGGRQRITLGKCGQLKVDQAREAAAVHAGDIAKHGVATTVVKKKEAKEATKAKVRLGSLIGEADGPPSPYEKYLAQHNIVNASVALSALRRGLAKRLKDDIKSLGRRDYMACFDAIADTGKKGAAKDCRKHTYKFLRWCEGRGHIDHNPLLGYREEKKSRADIIKEARRQGRRLTDDEIKKVWEACGKLGSFGLLVRMCLLTGARRSEPASMEWPKHVFDDRIVVVEDEKAKSGRTHEVPRTLMIDQVLDDAKHFQRATTDYVFPSNKTGREMSGFTKLVARLIREAGVQKFTLHDLRRTLRSIMADCGITSNDLQRVCVGQQPEKKLDQIYNLSKLWTIRKMIFDHVHDHIANLVGGPKSENVVRLFKNPVEQELLKRLAESEVALPKAELTNA